MTKQYGKLVSRGFGTEVYEEETGMPFMIGNAAMARGANYFEVPLISHVIDGLYQGCSPAEFPWVPRNGISWLEEEDITRILNLFVWGDYPINDDMVKVDVEMYDGGAVYEELDTLAEMVVTWLDEGHNVFVHCQAGLNRSSLVVARVLMMKYGMGAREAIAKIREQRSNMCLCNDDFRLHLLALEDRAA